VTWNDGTTSDFVVQRDLNKNSTIAQAETNINNFLAFHLSDYGVSGRCHVYALNWNANTISYTIIMSDDQAMLNALPSNWWTQFPPMIPS